MSLLSGNSLEASEPSWLTVRECTPELAPLNAVVLTFDIDWACDEVLQDSIDLVERVGAPATWFVTHDTPLLSRLRANKNFELGIHPNLNPLLTGTPGDAEQIIDDLLKIVPDAVSIRCHSLVQSSRLLDLFQSKGLIFDCNHFVPEQSGIELRPWRLWNEIVKIPHFWEDDAVCIYEHNASISDLLVRDGLKVFDFHPIHIFLNTEDLARYSRTRSLHHKAAKLLAHRYVGAGTRTHFLDLLDAFGDAK
jgi:hypothetical protein